MTDKEYERMMESQAKFAEKVKKMTKEEALALLMQCGHLDKDGNFTEPYKHLATVVKSI
jgi:diadenosine tetraphosphate (Ap4A) HIT family hydrolase